MEGAIAHDISYSSIIEAHSRGKTAMIHPIAVYISIIITRLFLSNKL